MLKQTGTIHQPVAHGSQDSLRAQTDRHHPPARRTRVPGFPPCSNSPRYEKGPLQALSLAAELRRRESWDPTGVYGCLENRLKTGSRPRDTQSSDQNSHQSWQHVSETTMQSRQTSIATRLALSDAPAGTPQSRKGSRLLSARVPQQEKGPLRALFLSEDCLSPEGSLEPSGSHRDD